VLAEAKDLVPGVEVLVIVALQTGRASSRQRSHSS
jgi:hypothetical protein